MNDETKERIVRAVLLFCAIVTAGVAAYTTFMLFSNYEIDISFSPPEDAASFESPDKPGQPESSFDIEQEHEDEEGETTTYEDEEIKPYQENNPIMKSPLMISEGLSKGRKIRIAFLLTLIEIAIIFLIYKKLDKILIFPRV